MQFFFDFEVFRLILFHFMGCIILSTHSNVTIYLFTFGICSISEFWWAFSTHKSLNVLIAG